VELPLLHFLVTEFANLEFMAIGSEALRGRRSPKEEQWEIPTVCAPDRVTISSRLSPLAANIASSTVMLPKGGGRLKRVSLAEETRQS
jgi:hypothetical protein